MNKMIIAVIFVCSMFFALAGPAQAEHPVFGEGYFSPDRILSKGGVLIYFDGNKKEKVKLYKCNAQYKKCNAIERETGKSGWFDDAMPFDYHVIKFNGSKIPIPPLAPSTVYTIGKHTTPMGVITYKHAPGKTRVYDIYGKKVGNSKDGDTSYFFLPAGTYSLLSEGRSIVVNVARNANVKINFADHSVQY